MKQSTGGNAASLKDAFRAAAASGDWITHYAIWQAQACWWALELDAP